MNLKFFLFVLLTITDHINLVGKHFLIETEDGEGKKDEKYYTYMEGEEDTEEDLETKITEKKRNLKALLEKFLGGSENPCGAGNIPRKCTCNSGASFTPSLRLDQVISTVSTCGPSGPDYCVCMDGTEVKPKWPRSLVIEAAAAVDYGLVGGGGGRGGGGGAGCIAIGIGCYGCFGPSSSVETKHGVKTISELRIGDEIRTSSDNTHTHFTEFLGWLDRQESSPAKMLQLFTTNNTTPVTLSASHVVFTSNSTMYAGDLVPGNILLRWDGVQMEERKITEIKTSLETGFWAPLTKSGTLLVDGFLMSSYASFPHQISDIAMAPIKALSTILLDDEESQHKDGVRKVIRLMKDVGRFIGSRREENGITQKYPNNVARFVGLESEL